MNLNKSDNELMNEFAGCSMDSFTMVFNRYKNRILNFVLRGYLHDKDNAEDIVQKTFIRVYEYKHKYNTTNQFSTWVYTIAKNLSLNELKRKRKLRADDDPDDTEKFLAEDESLSQKIEKQNIQELLTKAIELLKPKYREVIVMRYLQRMSYEEISEITSKRINTLKSQSKRGLKQIRDKVKNYGIEEEKVSTGN